ncbi:MAG: DUF5686 family protein [Chitinophagales bacterium]|nr:carboxypeptidase-like regulatory domain-containing protein [Bacteroidota bacterium]MCB9043248.1 carboxypeptidase-like regulatory domain-containing protein [Chitinophagales bacterium]
MMHIAFSRFLLWILILFPISIVAQQTEVSGVVRDALTGEALPFANVSFENSTIGTTTDYEGAFNLKTNDLRLNKLMVSYIGYETHSASIKVGQIQRIDFRLNASGVGLQEVVISETKKVPKDTLAIRLYRRVIENRKQNKADNFDSYTYKNYAKTQFDLYNVNEEMTQYSIFKPFAFVFDNIDTTEQNIPFLPMFLKEKISQFYYQKPKNFKEVVIADQLSGIDNFQLFEMIDFAFTEYNVYDNVYDIQGKGFLNPFAGGALASYKYFLTDTLTLENDTLYKLEFTPRRKQDLCFTGFAFIDAATAAITEIDLNIMKQTNLNFVTDFSISQKFVRKKEGWFKSNEEKSVVMNPLEADSLISVRITQTDQRYEIGVNEPIAADVFDGKVIDFKPMVYRQSENFWEVNRPTALNENEVAVYDNLEKVKSTKLYKKIDWTTHLLFSGFVRTGPIEFGNLYYGYSWNDIEGKRYRLSLRTYNREADKDHEIKGYVAYSSKLNRLNYGISGFWNLRNNRNLWERIGAYYTYDFDYLRSNGQYYSHDNIFVSMARRSAVNNLQLNHSVHLEYQREFKHNINTEWGITRQNIYAWPGTYHWLENNEDSLYTDKHTIKIVEIGGKVYWAGDTKFYLSGGNRYEIEGHLPIISLDCRISPSLNFSNPYPYQQLSLGVRQRLISRLGTTRLELEGGKVWGRLPLPLQNILLGNETSVFSRSTFFNMMGELEYTTDAWVTFKVRHNFEGLIFNAVPVVRKLKLRSQVYARGVYGTLSETNATEIPDRLSLQALDGFYAEAGFGITNILKMAQVHFIYRLTQNQKEGVVPFAIKFLVYPEF